LPVIFLGPNLKSAVTCIQIRIHDSTFVRTNLWQVESFRDPFKCIMSYIQSVYWRMYLYIISCIRGPCLRIYIYIISYIRGLYWRIFICYIVGEICMYHITHPISILEDISVYHIIYQRSILKNVSAVSYHTSEVFVKGNIYISYQWICV